MKKNYFLGMLTLMLANQIAAQFAEITFQNVNINGSENFWNGSDFSGQDNGSGVLTSSYSELVFDFKTVYDTSWGASYGYWSEGWAFSNQTSDTMTNLNGQHSSYAGGASVGQQYAIGQNNSYIVANNSYGGLSSFDISNSNYAAHSMLNGDLFAKKFGGASGNDPDWLLLSIFGYASLTDTVPYDSVEFYLADYRFSDNASDYIVKDWETVDISALDGAQKIVFELSSSDVGAWGMNTPAFFAIDNIVFSTLSVNTNLIDLGIYPNPTTTSLNVNGWTSNSQYEILSLEGKVLTKGNLTDSPIDVSNLSKGNYFIRLMNAQEVITQQFIKH